MPLSFRTAAYAVDILETFGVFWKNFSPYNSESYTLHSAHPHPPVYGPLLRLPSSFHFIFSPALSTPPPSKHCSIRSSYSSCDIVLGMATYGSRANFATTRSLRGNAPPKKQRKVRRNTNTTPTTISMGARREKVTPVTPFYTRRDSSYTQLGNRSDASVKGATERVSVEGRKDARSGREGD